MPSGTIAFRENRPHAFGVFRRALLPASCLGFVMGLIFFMSGCATIRENHTDKVGLPPAGIPMTGLFRYLADAALFTDCAGGDALPVAMEKDYLALERAYLDARREPGGPLRVALEGHFQKRPPMEGDGLVTVLVVDRFQAVLPDGGCPRPPAPADLENTYWRLTALYGKPVRFIGGGQGPPHLSLRTPERQMSGFSGCNGFFGLYRVAGNDLSFEDMAASMQACPNNHELQRRFYDALKATRNFQLLGNVLVLFDAQQEVARFTPGHR